MIDQAVRKQQQYYEQTAADYQQMHVVDGDEHYRALSYIATMARVWGISSFLDVGSGTGRAGEFLHDQGFQVRGVEPVNALIQQANRRRPSIGQLIQCGQGESLPFADGSFDAVCEFAVLHHVRHPNWVIQEMLRVARTAVFISDANRFGQVRLPVRLLKLSLSKLGLWSAVNFLKTLGRVYSYSEGDGVFYSYSVYDSLAQIASWAEETHIISTLGHCPSSWWQPLLTSQCVLLCGLKQIPTATFKVHD
jgi:ubiquinone/menaquinone biosynthesis C-methylase UbiE